MPTTANLLPRVSEKPGDVTGDEFDRRHEEYRSDLDGKYRHAEFIDGEIVFQEDNVKFRHRLCIGGFADLGRAFVRRHPIGIFESDGLLVQMTHNEFKPDLYFWPREVSDGFTDDDEIFPTPAFIAEVLSPSTAARDRGVKFRNYAAHGVREYWIADPVAQRVELYDLEGQTYRLRETVTVESGGTLRSVAIEGFEIPVAALFDDSASRAVLADLA